MLPAPNKETPTMAGPIRAADNDYRLNNAQSEMSRSEMKNWNPPDKKKNHNKYLYVNKNRRGS